MRRMINDNLLKMKKDIVFSTASFGFWKYDCVMNATDIFSFLPLINRSVTTE